MMNETRRIATREQEREREREGKSKCLLIRVLHYASNYASVGCDSPPPLPRALDEWHNSARITTNNKG